MRIILQFYLPLLVFFDLCSRVTCCLFLIHLSPASYSCYSKHIAPLGALPPAVPALPPCSIHPQLPPLPFVAMATNVGDSPPGPLV